MILAYPRGGALLVSISHDCCNTISYINTRKRLDFKLLRHAFSTVSGITIERLSSTLDCLRRLNIQGKLMCIVFLQVPGGI